MFATGDGLGRPQKMFSMLDEAVTAGRSARPRELVWLRRESPSAEPKVQVSNVGRNFYFK